jgi:Na+-transporting methylmalonyl-CoA/oxaloacetate decarboxylase gamma subunit
MNGLLAAGLTAALAAAVAADGLLPALATGVFPLLLLALSSAAAAGAGRRLVGALSPGLAEDEKSVAGATLGLGLLSLGTLALAALGLLKPWAASALLGALFVGGWAELEPLVRSLIDGGRRALERPWLCVLIGLPLLAALWACLVPPHQYDSLVYHLALPQEYLRTGRLHAPAGIVYAHFPQNGEMLFTLALALGSDLLAQMDVWLATALTIGWLLTFGRRVTPAAVWAAVLVATHTAVLLMSSTTYVEPLVMLWTTAALLAFEASEEGRENGPLLLSALFTGLALGTKYYAGLLAVLLVLRLVWRDRLKAAVWFAAVAGVVFAPWLIKNWIFVGNPVFPFLYKIFPATQIGWTAELASGYFQVLTEYGHAHGFFRDLLSLPILLFRNPLRFGGGMDVLGDLGWDLTLWLWVAGLWAAWTRRERRALAGLTALYFIGWFSTGVVLRFLTALAPAMALVGAAGVRAWREKAGAPARALAAAAAGLLIASHAFLFLVVHGEFESASVLLAKEDRGAFLSRRLEYYPCAMAAARSLGPNDKILIVGEQRGYYLTSAHLSSTVHAPNLYVTRANAAASSEELARALRSDGFTRLLLVPRESARLGESVGAFTTAGAANWKGLEKLLTVAYRGPACLLAAWSAP